MDGDIQALVEQAVSGDAAAFRSLVDRHVGLVWSIIRSYRLSRSDADDVAQGVWLVLVQHLGQLRDADRLPAWIATTTRRECLAAIKRNGRTPLAGEHLVDNLVATDTDADRRLLAGERSRALVEAMADLDARCRELLSLLSADPPLAYHDVSEVLGLPVGAIGPTRARCLDKVRQHRAIRRLKMV